MEFMSPQKKMKKKYQQKTSPSILHHKPDNFPFNTRMKRRNDETFFFHKQFGGNLFKSIFSITIPHLLRINSNKAKFQDCIRQNVVLSRKHFQEQKLRASHISLRNHVGEKNNISFYE
jgi:hypothetical protein